jgi:hypothetical protein
MRLITHQTVCIGHSDSTPVKPAHCSGCCIDRPMSKDSHTNWDFAISLYEVYVTYDTERIALSTPSIILILPCSSQQHDLSLNAKLLPTDHGSTVTCWQRNVNHHSPCLRPCDRSGSRITFVPRSLRPADGPWIPVGSNGRLSFAEHWHTARSSDGVQSTA